MKKTIHLLVFKLHTLKILKHTIACVIILFFFCDLSQELNNKIVIDRLSYQTNNLKTAIIQNTVLSLINLTNTVNILKF